MPDTTETTTTALTPAQVIGQLQAQQGATLRSVMGALAAMTAKRKSAVEPTPPVAVEVTEEEEAATLGLAEALAEVTWPTEVRALEPKEIEAYTRLRTQWINPTEALIKRTKESIREALFNHFDAKAEQAHRVAPDTPIDGKGHYVLPDADSARVPDCDQKLVRETKRGTLSFGTAVTLGDRLKALEDAGKITHQQYLRWTRPARLLDEDALYADAQKDEALYKIIEGITKVESPSASLNVRANQDETT
jgi:hypothetical protein